MLYIASRGPAHPARATIPFAAALMAAEAGAQAEILLSGDATLLMKEAAAKGVQADDRPPLRDLLCRVVACGIPVFACEVCSQARGITDDDLARIHARFVCPIAALELKTRAGRVFQL